MVHMAGHDCDPIGFAFWPLARVKSVAEAFAEHTLALPKVSDPARYFVFADYLQWSWAYAIHLNDRTQNQIPSFTWVPFTPKWSQVLSPNSWTCICGMPASCTLTPRLFSQLRRVFLFFGCPITPQLRVGL
jgi:hypothetical protein